MPDPVAIQIGPIQVRWYGILIMLGVLAASYIAVREARRRGENPDHVWQMFPWALIGGIVGARLFWVLAVWQERQFTSLIDVIAIWQGGLAMHGVIIGGALAVVLYSRFAKISFFKWTDIIAPGIALAQAIGRWGNYFNQEAFGTKTDLPWGIPISVERQREVAGPDFPADPIARFHPTFAYEMIWDLLNFGLLMWLGRQRRIQLREGDIFWVYLIFYSIGRFAIEELRLDSAMFNGLKVPQIVSIALIVAAWAALIWRHRPGSTAPYAEENLPVGARRAGLRAAQQPAEGRRQVAAAQPSRIRRVPVPNLTEEATEAPVGQPGPAPTALGGPEGSQAGT